MMDIADVNKVASRKRINEDAEKLREKVSRETAKIIKLKVAQDTAYWDLKEKLHQLENNHERLQQNMVDVQMQHEDLSGQYQEELRLRPETLNKLSGTRQICDVLEEYSERLKGTLSRCKADQGALCEAYARSGGLVRGLRARGEQAAAQAAAGRASLQEQLKLTLDHQTQLVQLFNSSKQQANDNLRELRNKLNTTQAQKEEILKSYNDLAKDVEAKKYELDAREQNISSLQSDLGRLMQECGARCKEMSDTIAHQEKCIKETSESNESLKTALSNQEQFTKSVCEENRALQEQLAARAEDADTARGREQRLQLQLQEITATCESLRADISALVDAKEALEKDVEQKNMMLAEAKTEAENLRSQCNNLENEKALVVAELNRLNEESSAKADDILSLMDAVRVCEEKVAALETCLEETRATNEEKTKELNKTIETKVSENKSKSETICKLMNDIAMCLEERSRLEMTIERGRKEMEVEKERTEEKEKKMAAHIEKLEAAVREKDQEIAKQISIIMEIRADKDKLQEKISSMRGKIDNISKELHGRAPPRPGPRPELDDNACSSPAHQMSAPPPAPRPQRPVFAAPRYEPRDSMVFGLLSDSSMDGDVVDPIEINRRFDALSRGERLPPAPLSALKRRRAGAGAGAGGKITRARDENEISLSQLRDAIQPKEKLFFKNKRPGEAKMQKRIKKPANNEPNNLAH